MIPTHGQRLLTEFMARKQSKGANLCSEEIVSAADDMVGVFLAEERKKWETAKKEKKKASLEEGSERVFNAYPRRVGGQDALASISKAIKRDGLETVLEGTLEFAAAVARWPKARLVSKSGTSFVPMPSTFYNNQRYILDDRKTWWEGTGKKELEEKQVLLLAEPQGWRFAHPNNRFVTENIPWASIDTFSQKWLIANTPHQQHTA